MRGVIPRNNVEWSPPTSRASNRFECHSVGADIEIRASMDEGKVTGGWRPVLAALVWPIVFSAFVIAAYWPFLAALRAKPLPPTKLNLPTATSRESIGEVVQWLVGHRDGAWKPLSRLSLFVDVEAHRADVSKIRVTNLALHVLAICLAFFVMAKIGASRLLAAFAASVLAVHPLCIQAVASLPGRAELLAAVFGLASVLALIDFARSGRAWSAAGALLLAICAAMASPTLATMPLLLPLIHWMAARGHCPARADVAAPPNEQSACLQRWCRACLAGGLIVAGVVAFGPFAASAQDLTTPAQFATRVALLPSWLATEMVRTLLPHWTCWQPPAGPMAAWSFLVAAIVALVAASALAIAKIRQAPLASAGWLWFVATVVPALEFAPFGTDENSRSYYYVPLIGLVAASVILLSSVVEAKTVRAIALPLIACANVTIFARMTLADCAAHEARWTALVTDDHRGDYWPATKPFPIRVPAVCGSTRWIDSLLAIDSAIERTRDESTIHCDLGIACDALGLPDAAAAHFRSAIDANQNCSPAESSLALLSLEQGQRAEAERHFWRALEINPFQAVPYVGIAKICEERGEIREALAYLRRALEIEPESSGKKSTGAGRIYAHERLDHAIERLGKALGKSPTDSTGR